uniref:Symplekin n=3 Tax=Cacopsylla melanoneura TaxID=428564 RepID=A0A8D8LHY2_9HEMI
MASTSKSSFDPMANPFYEKVTNWINEANVTRDQKKAIENLFKVKEIVIQKEPILLPTFLDTILSLQVSRNIEVKKFVVGFIEDVVKKVPEVIPRVIKSIVMLLNDDNFPVQKKVIQVSGMFYKHALGYIGDHGTSSDLNNLWDLLTRIKTSIIDLVDGDNDGIRTQSIKFLETIVLLQTYSDMESSGGGIQDSFSLNNLPPGLKVAKRRQLEEEAQVVFDLIVKFCSSSHISSVNLMASMGSIVNIARMRPQFTGRVVSALELLHTNLPPTLSKSQVISVRKQMKNNLLSLLKSPGSYDYQSNISTLLTDLGATYAEVMKVMPKPEEIRARQMKRSSEASVVGGSEPPSGPPGAKKPRVEEPQSQAVPLSSSLVSSLETNLNQSEAWICERLNPEVTTQIVLHSLPRLPPTMPPHFVSSYTPIAAAGTPGQKKHVSRLLATQFSAAGVTIGLDGVPAIPVPPPRSNTTMDMMPHIPLHDPTPLPPAAPSIPPRRVPVRLTRVLKLSEVTKPLSRSTRENLSLAAVKRILRNEEMSAMCGGTMSRIKILTTMATSFNQDIREVIHEYLLSNLSSRMDLALAWLFEEYCLLQGFTKNPPVLVKDSKEKEKEQAYLYNNLLCAITRTIVINLSKDKEYEDCLIKLYAEAPLITDDAIDIIRGLCVSHYELGLNIFYQMVICRPPKQLHCLNALLSLCTYNSAEIRDYAISLVLDLYSRSELSHIIEEYASFYLGFLRLATPPDVLFGNDKGRPDKQSEWSEDVAKSCIFLYLSLLSTNEILIHELASVYVATVQDVKRVILRLLEVPVRGMGMTSPELLKLIETCPAGAETLITRIVHIITEGQTPSEVLVSKIRELYNSRVSDVRFLIPVLGGLPKREILAALHKLIKLNPVVVKEVFNRLLGDANNQENAPLTPAELMIALHTIDGAKVDLKYVIKATSLCFAETAIYTQEVLALVLQNLIEVNPLPTLFMRTVIQSLSHFPRLIGFIMNILQRLILKQVWDQKTVWEGFIKCCQRTVPQSYQVILQLPPLQLSDLFGKCPELKSPLLDHVLSFTENQRAHIPQGVMDVLYGDVNPIYETVHIKAEPKSPPDLSIDLKEPQQVL